MYINRYKKRYFALNLYETSFVNKLQNLQFYKTN